MDPSLPNPCHLHQHPLFPWPNPTQPPPLEEQPILESIKVGRQERTGVVFQKRKWLPAELTDEEAIADRHGAGLYIFMAFGSWPDGSRSIVTRREINLAGGASKPLDYDPNAIPDEAPAPVVAAAAPASAKEDGVDKALRVAVALGLPALIQGMINDRRASEQRERENQSQMTMRMAEMQQASHDNTLKLITALTAQQGAAAPSGNPFKEGIDFAFDRLASMAPDAPAAPPEDDLKKTMETFSMGLSALHQAKELAKSDAAPEPEPEPDPEPEPVFQAPPVLRTKPNGVHHSTPPAPPSSPPKPAEA